MSSFKNTKEINITTKKYQINMNYDDSELSEQISKEQYVNFVNLVIKCYDYLDFIQIVRNIEKSI